MEDVKQKDESNVFLLPDRQASQLRNAVAKALRSGEDADSKGALAHPIDLPTEEVNSEEQEQDSSPYAEGVRFCPIEVEQIQLNRFQTREFAGEEQIEGLAKSISEKGVIQPVIVRPIAEDLSSAAQFELVAGERRLRAAKAAGLQFVPAIVADLSDLETVEVSIIENAQREDLNPIEEALSYKILSEQFKMKQADIAQAIGKSRPYISNALRLLQLEPEVVEFIKKGELSAGHGRALLTVDDPSMQLKLARRAARGQLPVRVLEDIVSRLRSEPEECSDEQLYDLNQMQRQENRLRNILDIERVKVSRDTQGKKRLQIVFESDAAWKRFMSRVRD